MKQPTMMNCKMIRIGFLLALFMLTTSISRASKPEEKDYAGYLFTYFTGNHISEEAVCFAVSTDGYSFYALNDNKPRRARPAYPAVRRRENVLYGRDRHGIG